MENFENYVLLLKNWEAPVKTQRNLLLIEVLYNVLKLQIL